MPLDGDHGAQGAVWVIAERIAVPVGLDRIVEPAAFDEHDHDVPVAFAGVEVAVVLGSLPDGDAMALSLLAKSTPLVVFICAPLLRSSIAQL